MVMVSLECGVVRNTITNMKKIVYLGINNVMASAALEIMKIFVIVENEVMGEKGKNQGHVRPPNPQFCRRHQGLLLQMDFDALSRMIQNLENHIWDSNYIRDLLLCLVFIIYIFLSNLWAVFSIVNQKGNVILD